jgi:predicted S18 family serine protease
VCKINVTIIGEALMKSVLCIVLITCLISCAATTPAPQAYQTKHVRTQTVDENGELVYVNKTIKVKADPEPPSGAEKFGKFMLEVLDSMLMPSYF